MHAGIAFNLFLFQLLDAVDVSEVLQAFHARFFERVGSLLAQLRAIYQEQHPPEAICFEQAVDQSNAGFGFASACRHRQQHLLLAGFNRGFGALNCLALVGAQWEAVVKALPSQLIMSLLAVLPGQLFEAFWGVPAIKRLREVGVFAGVAKPDAALGF